MYGKWYYFRDVVGISVILGTAMFMRCSNSFGWADRHDKRENSWKSMTLYRDRRGKLAQEIGQNILDAMETSSRNPQPFTAKSASIT